MCLRWIVLLFCFCGNNIDGSCLESHITDEAQAQEFLDHYDERGSTLFPENRELWWSYYTNVTDHNRNVAIAHDAIEAEFVKEAEQNATCFAWKNFTSEVMRRNFKSIAGEKVLDEPERTQLRELQTEMGRIYNEGKVCGRPGDSDKSKCYSLNPDLTDIFRTSRDWDELEWAWKGWRDATGKHMKQEYVDHVELLNKKAKLSDFADAGEKWRDLYDEENFEANTKRLFDQIMNLYRPLHAYVRNKLKTLYSARVSDFPASGHIPAHILGNNWAQSWNSLLQDVLPFPGRSQTDVTNALKAQNYTVVQMYEVAETFFKSLGFEALPQEFWDHSLIEKPTDKEAICHGSAWDFLNAKDFRILFCTTLTHQDLMVVHHELGHIYYFIDYKHQPLSFRDGANPAVHEAIGDLILLSAATPEYLHSIGLLNSSTNAREDTLNYLMLKALETTAFLPFGYLMDQWRWDVFNGKTKPEDYNKAWWNLRCRIQGVSPPVTRSEQDFDPGAKFHIPNDVPYIRYFLSSIQMYQYQKSLCAIAGHQGPLHECNLFGNAAAGDKLRSMLRLGSSRSFPDTFKLVTNTETVSAEPLVEYFQPLIEWLEEQNAGVELGWEDECPEESFTNVSPIASVSSITVTALIFLHWLLLSRYNRG